MEESRHEHVEAGADDIVKRMRLSRCWMFVDDEEESAYQTEVMPLRRLRFQLALGVCLALNFAFEAIDGLTGTFTAAPKRVSSVIAGVVVVGVAGLVRWRATEYGQFFNLLASALVVMTCVSFVYRIDEEVECAEENGGNGEVDEATKAFITSRLVMTSLFSLLFGPLELEWTMVLHVLLLSGWHVYVLAVVKTLRDTLVATDIFLIVLFCAGGLGVSFAEKQARVSFGLSQAMRKRLSDVVAKQGETKALLLNILPESIFEELGGEIRTIAHRYEASVMFAILDDVPPTLSPSELIDVLNRFVSLCDLLCLQFGVQKIKTVGSVYMAASGLPERNGDHALRCAAFALALQRSLPTLSRESGLSLSVRVGINTGPVVGGVLGSLKSIFDCFSDAVNVASRMESSAPAGRIQVSADTADALRTQRTTFLPGIADAHWLALVPRGATPIKGKGVMFCWFVGEEDGTDHFLDRMATNRTE